MRGFKDGQRDQRRDSRGQGFLEYMVVLALIAVVVIAAVPHIKAALTSNAANAQAGMSYTGGAGAGTGAPWNVAVTYPLGAVVEYVGVTYTATTTVPSGAGYTPGTTADWSPYSVPGPAGTTANTVWGQDGLLNCGQYDNSDNGFCGNGGLVKAANLGYVPYGVVVDSSGDVYISDAGNKRVLYFAAGSTTATRVYGQDGQDFTCGVGDNTGSGCTAGTTPSATNFSEPTGLALDGSGNLYVADFGNNRVLEFPAGNTTASKVYGQSGSFTCGVVDNTGSGCTSSTNATAANLFQPSGVAVDSSGNVYIADQYDNRILEYTGGSTTAHAVYGQIGYFTAGACCYNDVGLGQGTPKNYNMWRPTDVALDSSNNLYFTDAENSRVMEFPAGNGCTGPGVPSNCSTANKVWGQDGQDFTCGAADNTGSSCTAGSSPSATDMNYPNSLAVDSHGNIYVSDLNNYRVLYYASGSTTATAVYGQNSLYTCGVIDNTGSGCTAGSTPSATNLEEWPEGIAVDSSNDLYIVDSYNNRVLEYPHS